MSELSRETDALLERGRDGESLAPHDRARLKRALLAQVAGVSVVATTSTAAAWTAVAAKVVGVVVLVGSVGFGVATVLPPRTPAVAAHVAGETNRSASSPTKASVAAPPRAPLATSAPAAPTAAPLPKEKPASDESRQAARVISTEPEVRAAALAASSATSSLEEEARLLREADEALKAGDPSRTLRLLGDLATRFPDSTLAPERAAERVFALCMAGRQDEARGAAADFLRTQDVGPLAARVRASCGGVAR
jgi:hypothetical protein